jgi:spore germination cell wall hydrolase CwlJ-like protein
MKIDIAKKITGEDEGEERVIGSSMFVAKGKGETLVVRKNPTGSCKYCHFYDKENEQPRCVYDDFKQGPCSSKTRSDGEDVIFLDKATKEQLDKDLLAFGQRKRLDEGAGLRSFLAGAMLAAAPLSNIEGATKPVSNKPAITAKALTPKEQILKRRTEIVAKTIYTEAAGESYDGKRAIATVIQNRSKHARWKSKTLSEICREKFQFSGWNKGEPTIKINNPGDQKAWDDSVAIAKSLVYGGFKPVAEIKDSNHYYNPKKATPSWGNKLQNVVFFGNHKFGKL